LLKEEGRETGLELLLQLRANWDCAHISLAQFLANASYLLRTKSTRILPPALDSGSNELRKGVWIPLIEVTIGNPIFANIIWVKNL
jgi:hypothetical protein